MGSSEIDIYIKRILDEIIRILQEREAELIKAIAEQAGKPLPPLELEEVGKRKFLENAIKFQGLQAVRDEINKTLESYGLEKDDFWKGKTKTSLKSGREVSISVTAMITQLTITIITRNLSDIQPIAFKIFEMLLTRYPVLDAEERKIIATQLLDKMVAVSKHTQRLITDNAFTP
jgi:hypothetical protein